MICFITRTACGSFGPSNKSPEGPAQSAAGEAGRQVSELMWYWRDEDFSSLSEASRIASDNPAWTEFAKYCELLERGLRKDALAHLSEFIESTLIWSFAERKEFVSWLYHYAYPK